jgi:4-hydroxy-3-polyprenylbenzoate decarboxylase
MSFTDLQHYINSLEQTGQLHRISAEADPVYEITEIADRVVKSQGPALYFERPKGSPYPLAINLFGTYERACRALGVEDFNEIGSRISSYLSRSSSLSSFTDKIKFLWSLKDLKNIQPARVRKAPAQEVVESDGSLADLPVLKCWPDDAGRFITLPLVFTKHPESGNSNMGMYRIQIIDEKRALMHWHAHHDGARHHRLAAAGGADLEAAIVLGADPATIYSATAPLPPDIDELLFAGFLRNKPVETVAAKTVDLMVPAHAEFVLEGTVSVSETMPEGPFGDHTGFYSGVDHYPVFTLKALTRKRNPVYPATIVGPPPMEDYYLGKATERIFLPLIRMQLPEVVDINFPAEGVFHNCLLVSIDKQFPGHARKVASSMWGMGQMMLTKLIILVDKDVDVQNISETAWKVFSNIDPERDFFFSRGPLDVLDHASPEPMYGSKAGVDATRKHPEEGHRRPWPDEIRMSDDIRQLVSRRWKEYGLG